ncbi:DUF4180 domain-containing protein [Caulobacter sp. KR2-114]|uniref:DUF4180 domain-containing protein n=1 Tax=Caulobacter sp. KR2-114 TaxID=3400912 RepID=UPI003C0550FE
MSDTPDFQVIDLAGRRVLLAAGLDVSAPGAPVASERDATDLVGEALGAGADTIAVPVGRLSPAFFDLKTGLAGAILQKTTNYRLGFAVVGEIPADALRSEALRAFIAESNRRGVVLFVADLAELEARLGAAG